MEGAISTLLQPLSKLALMMPMTLVPITSDPPPPSPLPREPEAQITAAVAFRSSAVALGAWLHFLEQVQDGFSLQIISKNQGPDSGIVC
jgi:hypothetical protein